MSLRIAAVVTVASYGSGPTTAPVAYEISEQGIVSLSEKENAESTALSKEYPELLNPEFWATDDDDLV